MTSSGYIDWHRLRRAHPVREDQHTFIYAYWPVDGDLPNGPDGNPDAGLSILKPHGHHPDWFLYADDADEHLYAVVPPRVHWASHSVFDVFPDGKPLARPLLASVLLGTARYSLADWFCQKDDLIWTGQRLVQKLDQLYLRPAVIVTFIQTPADGKTGSREQEDPATVN